MTDKQQSAREQIEALQASMKADQLEAAKELAMLVAAAEVGAVIEKLIEIRNRSIPGQSIDQLVNQLIAVIGHTGQQAAAVAQQLASQG